MRDLPHGLHRLFLEFHTRTPLPRVGEAVDLDAVVVARCRDVASAAPARVRHRQAGCVLAEEGWCAGVAPAGDLAQVPDLEGAVEGRGCDQVGEGRVQGETADLLVGEAPDFGGRGLGADVVTPERALQGGEDNDIGIGGGHVNGTDGEVFVGVGGGEDLGGYALVEIEFPDGGIVGGCVDSVCVNRGEEEPGDGAGVRLES